MDKCATCGAEINGEARAVYGGDHYCGECVAAAFIQLLADWFKDEPPGLDTGGEK